MSARAYLPAFPAPHDDEAELGMLAARVTPAADADQAELAAVASDLLREIGELDREHARFAAARDAEVARITMRYSAQLDRLARRRSILESAVGAIADRVDFGKRKTMKVGYGSFGRRTVPERVRIVSATDVLAWAERSAPSLVRTVERKDVPHGWVLDHYRQTGELPDGCEYTASHEELVVKPELGAVIGGEGIE